MKTSLWKWVPGFVGHYKFNGFDVLSVERYVKQRTKFGKTIKIKRNSILLKEKPSGYSYVGYLLYKNGFKKTFRKHRLVWWYYNGKIPNGLEINHKNGVKSENRIENLELVTTKENQLHSRTILGNTQIGENSVLSVLRNKDVLKIRKMLARGFKGVEIAKKYNVSTQTISSIKTGLRYRGVN